jgi:hypothetical protein
MVYNFSGFKMSTPILKRTEISMNWHFVYQLPLVISVLYYTAGTKLSMLLIPVAGLWAIWWANHYN